MLVGVTGSRSIHDRAFISNILSPENFYITGDADGVDKLTKSIAGDQCIALKPINKYLSLKYTPNYYYGRDWQIADCSDYLIAIWDGDSRGTYYTITCALKLGKKVLLYEYPDPVPRTIMGMEVFIAQYGKN